MASYKSAEIELSNKPEIVTRNRQIATVSDILSEIILLAIPLLSEQKFQCLESDERAMTLPFRALTPSPWIPQRKWQRANKCSAIVAD